MNPQEVIAVHREMTEEFHDMETSRAVTSGLFLCGMLLFAILMLVLALSSGEPPSVPE